LYRYFSDFYTKLTAVSTEPCVFKNNKKGVQKSVTEYS